jgi:hypothetical protein
MVAPRGDQKGRQIRFWLVGLTWIVQIPEALSTVKCELRGSYFSAGKKTQVHSEPFFSPFRRRHLSTYDG